jgi:hypothetical protein
MTTFDRKGYTRDEINILIAEQLKICIEPICFEIGKVIDSLQKRIVHLEMANNAMIREMKEWKAKNQKTIQ